MPNLEIIIFNQTLKLSYQENEKQRLFKAVEALNNRWNKFSTLHGKVSDLKIIALISLELQDLIEDLESLKIKNIKLDSNLEILKNEIQIKNKELESNTEIKKKLDEKIIQKNKEISKIEISLEEINADLLQIKSNLLNKNE